MKNSRIYAILSLILMMGALFVACGGSSGDGVIITTPNSKYVYVSNTNEDTISAFRINSSSGTLSFIGNTALTNGSAPTGLALHPNGKYLYSANAHQKGSNGPPLPPGGFGNITSYMINSTGGLEEIGTALQYSNNQPHNLVLNPSGEYLYLADSNGHHAFSINATSGEPTETAFSPFYSDTEPHGIAMHPSGNFLFSDACSGTHSYVLNSTTGEATDAPNSPLASTGSCEVWMDVTPDGRYLYTADVSVADGETIRGYLINSITGEITLLGGFPTGVPGSTSSKSMAITPNGKYLYVTHWYTDEVSAHVINSADGSLTPVPNMPFSTEVWPKSVTVDRLGRHLYVANNFSNSVSAYSINDATGELTGIANYPTGWGPKMILTAP